MVSQNFTLTSAGRIEFAPGQKSITADKGESVQFVLTNNSGQNLKDWGLYFNNPFDVSNSLRYSFGDLQVNGNVYTAEKTISLDTAEAKVAKYNAYAIYVTVENSSGTVTIFQRDPEIIVNGGDVED